jgi:hypothetical protein
MDSLEARDDRDFVAGETCGQTRLFNGFDAGGAMGVRGADGDLPALP